MGKGRELQRYDYVNHPYAAVREALVADAVGVVQRATSRAAERVDSVGAKLRVNLGPIEVGAAIDVQVTKIEEVTAFGGPATRLHLAWKAARRPELFPTMEATLTVYPLSPDETQLDFEGRYQPPLGPVGDLLDAMVGHRLAEAAVHRLVEDVAGWLRQHLAPA
jgi:hypothetical protein